MRHRPVIESIKFPLVDHQDFAPNGFKGMPPPWEDLKPVTVAGTLERLEFTDPETIVPLDIATQPLVPPVTDKGVELFPKKENEDDTRK